MQTDLGGEIEIQTCTASYLYAARYGYSDTVLHNDNQIKLFPRQDEGQVPIQSHLWTVPEGRGVEYSDRFGNRVYRSQVIQPHTTLLTGDSGASPRGCLAAALYNATQVAPVEIIQIIRAAIQTVDDLEDSPSTAEHVATLMQDILALIDELHQAIGAAWFHTEALSGEEVYRRFVQQ